MHVHNGYPDRTALFCGNNNDNNNNNNDDDDDDDANHLQLSYSSKSVLK